MISLVQVNLATLSASSVEQSVSFLASSVQGNLLVVVGKYDVSPGSVVTVTDSAGNIYSTNQPLNDLVGSSYWFAYTVLKSTEIITVTVVYSTTVTTAVFAVIEFFVSFGWVNPPVPDGLSFASAASGATALTSPPITTTNADDLIIVLYAMSNGSTVTLSSGWNDLIQIEPSRAVVWKESSSAGSVAFAATQSVIGLFSVSLWSVQANIVAPNTINITTAVVNPTAFPESYPNRITEDIYDSLSGHPTFVYVKYGPTLNG